MKERIFHNEEFEKQLKDKADQFKMYPSDKVWNEVYSSLHTRRRRFVAGMTVLIGSILILAGSQLIFPTKNIHPKTISLKPNIPAKPATVANLNGFTENSYAPNPSDASGDADGNLNSNTPFSIPPASTVKQTIADVKSENLPEKMVNTAREKFIQPAELNIPVALGSSTDAPAENNESITSTQNIAEISTVQSEPVNEKSTTRLSHNRNDRFSWEIYVAPTLNTHYLYGIDYQTVSQSIQSAPIMLVNVSNVNGFVDNTPVLGYDIGGNILYKLSRNLSLKAGLAFSFNRYYIKAYNSNQPQASAMLNSYLGYVADSLQNASAGFGTDKNPQHYQNRYYQLSMPVGVEMIVAGKGKVQLHLGATVEPSYLLNTDAYVLSDDYKGYVKDPQAFRRWNMNVGAEAFVSYSVGKIRWELGPQVRYQIFSTYKNSYPLHENMLNYGIRIGISKTIR
jgi:hypothetical protein